MNKNILHLHQASEIPVQRILRLPDDNQHSLSPSVVWSGNLSRRKCRTPSHWQCNPSRTSNIIIYLLSKRKSKEFRTTCPLRFSLGYALKRNAQTFPTRKLLLRNWNWLESVNAMQCVQESAIMPHEWSWNMAPSRDEECNLRGVRTLPDRVRLVMFVLREECRNVIFMGKFAC